MIMRANAAKSPDDVCAGRILEVPETGYCGDKPALPCMAYTVQEEDSLYSIARKFGITMRMLTRANDMDGADDRLRAGDTLRIPRISGQRYCVRPGESVKDIAHRMGVSEARIRTVNALGMDESVHAGMMLVIG
jgi:spore germination protein YaaH